MMHTTATLERDRPLAGARWQWGSPRLSGQSQDREQKLG